MLTKRRADGKTASAPPAEGGARPRPISRQASNRDATPPIAHPPDVTDQLATYRDGSAGASAGIVTSDVFSQPCGVPFDCA